MLGKFEINPLNPNEQVQQSFNESVHLLLNANSVSPFGKTVTLPNNVTLTFSHPGIITYKIKYQYLKDRNDWPRYLAFYNNKPFAAGKNGNLSIVHVVFKYPSVNGSSNDAAMMAPLKVKYPANLVLKSAKKTQNCDLTFFKKEYNNGRNFIKMPFDIVENDTHSMLLMEKVRGIPLSEFIKQLHENPSLITAKTYLLIVLNLLKALDIIHKEKIFHCDILPENILIDSDYTIRFIDFGLSKRLIDKPTWASGTDRYFPPNERNNTFKTDIYSVCLIITELLGQTDRYYLRTLDELVARNTNVLVDEIFLGIEGFSSAEMKAIKQTLKSTLYYDASKRLDDLSKLITFFEEQFEAHTASSISEHIIPDRIYIQDIIALLKKGAPVLLADIKEWFSAQALNSVGKDEWCRVALYLYSQIKDEADAYFKCADIEHDFIQAFIAKLPSQCDWGDPTHPDYVENALNLQTLKENNINLISTNTVIDKGIYCLNKLKNQCGLNDDLYQKCLSALNEALNTLNDQSVQIVEPLIIMMLSISTIITELSEHNQNKKLAPELGCWLNLELPRLLVNVNTIVDLHEAHTALIRYHSYNRRYLLLKFNLNVEQDAMVLLAQYSQSIFKKILPKDICRSLHTFEFNRSKLIDMTIKLMLLKKNLYYAGCWEKINEQFKKYFEQLLTNQQADSNRVFKELTTTISIGQEIAVFFSMREDFSSNLQCDIFYTVANAMLEKRMIPDRRLYIALQYNAGLKPPNRPYDQSWFEPVLKHCETLALREATNALINNLPAISVVPGSMFKTDSPLRNQDTNDRIAP